MGNKRYYAVIANRLIDGAVVFRTDSNRWSLDFAEASISDDETKLANWLAEAEELVSQNQLIKPYQFEVIAKDNGGWRAEHFREALRIAGPAVQQQAFKSWRETIAPAVFPNSLSGEVVQDVSL